MTWADQADPRLPRLLRGLRADGAAVSLADHLTHHGPLPAAGRAGIAESFIGEVERAGLCGRGGAGFPTARKLAAVAAGRARRVVVANGAEGEPVSAKDGLLLAQLPHLVLDGMAVAAEAVGAEAAIVATKGSAVDAVRAAVTERARRGVDRTPVQVTEVPDRFVIGEESALVDFLDGGRGLPRFVPPRVFERGVGGRPTLVQNVETLTHLALIARHGARWFRAIGTQAEPGSTLVTLGGALAQTGVYEVARGSTLAQLVSDAGGPTEPLQAFLVGGYAGAWIAVDATLDVALSDEGLGRRGGLLGAGVLRALPARTCGVRQTALILSYLAKESAGQCGPCVHGLAAIAATTQDLARGAARRDALRRLENWAWQVTGRGACHHPDGATRLLASALRTFKDDIAAHRQGRCLAVRR